MTSSLEQKYHEFLAATGDTLEKLKYIGYDIPYVKNNIGSFEEFKKVVTDEGYLKRDYMIKNLKICYKNYISRGDLAQLLKNGETGFTDHEIAEAVRMLPVDIDGGISVDELVDFLYK